MANRRSVSIGAGVGEDRDLENDADAKALAREAEEEKNPDFHIPKLGQIAPVVPVRWIDVEDDDRPYQNPHQEYVRSPFPLDLGTLANRWDGIWKLWQIEDEYHRNNWPHERFKYQDEKDRLAFESSLANDKEFQARILNKDVEQSQILIDRLMGDFVNGTEYAKVKGAGAFGYVKMPMTVDSRVKLAAMITKVSQFRGARVGLVSDIIGTLNKVEVTVQDEMRAAMSEQDSQYARLLQVAGIKNSILDSQIKALPPGQKIEDATVEGEVVENVETA